MQDGERLKFQVRCMRQYAPVPEYQPRYWYPYFFMGILEKLGIFYFQLRRMYTDNAFSVRNGCFRGLVPEVGALFLAGHQVDHILFSISILKGGYHGNGDSRSRYRCRCSLVFHVQRWTERIILIWLRHSELRVNCSFKSISRCSSQKARASASLLTFYSRGSKVLCKWLFLALDWLMCSR